MDTIMTWDNYFKDSPLTRHAKLGQAALKRGVFLPPQGPLSDKVLPLVVNIGRWVVICPFCFGAEFAREDGLFMCQSCWNAKAGRQYQRAAFPLERKEIESILLKRLDPQTRNWTPGETVVDLLLENAALGKEA
jgi:hypothetical protein